MSAKICLITNAVREFVITISHHRDIDNDHSYRVTPGDGQVLVIPAIFGLVSLEFFRHVTLVTYPSFFVFPGWDSLDSTRYSTTVTFRVTENHLWRFRHALIEQLNAKIVECWNSKVVKRSKNNNYRQQRDILRTRVSYSMI